MLLTDLEWYVMNYNIDIALWVGAHFREFWCKLQAKNSQSVRNDDLNRSFLHMIADYV